MTPTFRAVQQSDVTPALPLRRELQWFGTHQPACKALVDAQYGIGGLLSVVVWSELGDCRRFSRSEQVVRHTGLDVTVHLHIIGTGDKVQNVPAWDAVINDRSNVNQDSLSHHDKT